MMENQKKVSNPYRLLQYKKLKKKLFDDPIPCSSNAKMQDQTKNLSRRPIIPDANFIDPDILDTSDGKFIAGWMKLRSERPKQRVQLFDLEAARKRCAPKLSLHYLPDDEENDENTSPESVNSDQSQKAETENRQQQQQQLVECPTTSTEQDKQNNSLFNRFTNTVKSMLPQRNSPKKSPRKSKGLSPRRATLTRREILTNIDKKSSYGVMSTPITGHRASLNASESPIRLASGSSRRLTVLNPEKLNAVNEQKLQKTPKKVHNNSKCTVVVLENVEIAPIEISSDEVEPLQNEDKRSPIGILQRHDYIRPKNLSNLIEQNKSRRSSSLSLSMIPERNENFEQVDTESDSGCEEIANNENFVHLDHDYEVFVPETQANEEIIPETQDMEEVPETQEDPQQEEEIIPEAQEEPQPSRNKRRGRRTSTSSNSSISSGLPLPHFNESLLPMNDIQTRSPLGPPLLSTILNVEDTNETVARPNVTRKSGKRKTTVNTAAQAYFDLNKSVEKRSSLSKSRRKTPNKSVKRSKKRLYSQRFEEESAESTSPDNTETRNEEVIIPETQEDAPSESEREVETRKSGLIMPPPPAPPQKSKTKKKSHATNYVSPEDSIPRDNSKSVPVSVYVDSDELSDNTSEKSTKTTKSKRRNFTGLKPMPLVESYDTSENGTRRSKRTKYLRPLNPGEKPKLVTTEELHEVYAKIGKEDHYGAYLQKRDSKLKKSNHSSASSVSSVATSRISKKKVIAAKKTNNVNKENRPVAAQEQLQDITEEPEMAIVSSSVQSPVVTKPLKRTKNRNATNPASIAVQSATDDDNVDEPSAKRTRNDPQENVTTADDDSGLHTVSENNSTSHIRQENSAMITHGEVSSTIEPATSTAVEQATGNVSRSSQRFDWILNLMQEKNDEIEFNLQENEDNEFMSNENTKFVEIDGIQYASYVGEKFKNCGYMKIGANSMKREAKAKKFDLRFLVIKAKDVEVKLPNMTIKPLEGSMFFVNKGTAYSIANNSSSVCLLYFTRS